MLVYLTLMPLLTHSSTLICRFTLARTNHPLLTRQSALVQNIIVLVYLVLHCHDFDTRHLPVLSTHSSTRQSALVQNISVLVYLVLICFIIFTGASQVDTSNYTPYAPFGADVSAWAGTGQLGKGKGDVFLWGDGSGLVEIGEGVNMICGLNGCAAAARGAV